MRAKKRSTKSDKQQTSVAAQLKLLRVDRELTQEKLAQKSGIDRKTINRIENLLFSPSMDTFFRICGALGVKPNDVIKKAVNK
jgi:putative transcriptional regulator